LSCNHIALSKRMFFAFHTVTSGTLGIQRRNIDLRFCLFGFGCDMLFRFRFTTCHSVDNSFCLFVCLLFYARSSFLGGCRLFGSGFLFSDFRFLLCRR